MIMVRIHTRHIRVHSHWNYYKFRRHHFRSTNVSQRWTSFDKISSNGLRATCLVIRKKSRPKFNALWAKKLNAEMKLLFHILRKQYGVRIEWVYHNSICCPNNQVNWSKSFGLCDVSNRFEGIDVIDVIIWRRWILLLLSLRHSHKITFTIPSTNSIESLKETSCSSVRIDLMST